MSSPAPRDPSGDAPQRVRIRRAPKVPVFLAIGAVLGTLAALIGTTVGRVDPLVGFGATFGYFLLFGLPAGVVLGAIVAIVLDVVANRRATEVTVAHEQVETPEPAPQAEPEAPASDAAEIGTAEPDTAQPDTTAPEADEPKA